ncbi:Nn.00g043700.m01.CDS01 [Neocucurbitaria sp. VM-36]
MDDRHFEVLAVAALFFVLVWLTVSLRVYVRGFMMGTWGTDVSQSCADTYMIATALVFTIYLAFQVVAAVHGTGRHRWDLSDKNARIALMFWYLCELLYVWTNCLLKFAIGYFYLRVAVQRWHVWCIKLLMAGTVFFGLVYFFLVLFQCLPINEFWTNHPASNKCLPKGLTLGITYALAAVNAAADWAFGTLPFFIVWDLKMKLKTKLLVTGILAFAAIGSTGTIVRMFYIHTLFDGPDFLYATTDIAIWSTVEPGIGITAACIATLRPLVQQCLWRIGLGSAPRDRRSGNPSLSTSNQKRKDRRGYRRSLSPSDLVPTDPSGTTSTAIYGPKRVQHQNMVAPSTIVVTEDRPTPDGHIMQTFTFEQEIESAPRLHLRDSFRNSFTRGSILSHGKFRIPT